MVKAKEDKYAVSIRYRDGGVDKYHGIKSAEVVENTLRVTESDGTNTYIVLDIIGYFRIEKED